MMDEAVCGQCAFDPKRDNRVKNTLWLLASPESPNQSGHFWKMFIGKVLIL